MVVRVNGRRHPVAGTAQRPARVRIGHLGHAPDRIVDERFRAHGIYAIEVGQGGLQHCSPHVVLCLHGNGLTVRPGLLLRDRAPKPIKISPGGQPGLGICLNVLRADRAEAVIGRARPAAVRKVHLALAPKDIVGRGDHRIVGIGHALDLSIQA